MGSQGPGSVKRSISDIFALYEKYGDSVKIDSDGSVRLELSQSGTYLYKLSRLKEDLEEAYGNARKELHSISKDLKDLAGDTSS